MLQSRIAVVSPTGAMTAYKIRHQYGTDTLVGLCAASFGALILLFSERNTRVAAHKRWISVPTLSSFVTIISGKHKDKQGYIWGEDNTPRSDGV